MVLRENKLYHDFLVNAFLVLCIFYQHIFYNIFVQFGQFPQNRDTGILKFIQFTLTINGANIFLDIIWMGQS